MSTKKIILIVFSIILSLSIISFAGCNKNKKVVDLSEAELDWQLEKAPVAEDILSTRVKTIDTAIANGEDVTAAVLHLYNVGEENMIAAPYFATYSDGSGTAETGSFSGGMTVRSFYIKNVDSYSASSSVVTDMKNNGKELTASLQDGLKGLLESTSRSYYDKETDTRYKQKTSGTASNANFDDIGLPTGSFYSEAKKTKSTKWTCSNASALALYMKQERVRKIGEKFNHILCAEAIENVSVAHNEAGYYTVKFSFKIDDYTAENYTNFGRDGLRESASSEDLKYVKLNYSFDIWDNGYFRNFGSEESWAATLKVAILTLKGASQSTNLERFTWVKDDCDIDEYDDFISDDDFTFAEAVED